jgi:glutamate 5-kinase
LRDLGPLRRLVVKLGSTTVLGPEYAGLLTELAGLRLGGSEVVIVSSGAVGLGMRALGILQRPKELPRIQALAALGQADLMARYQEALAPFGLRSAQVLLTHEALSKRTNFMNVRHTLTEVLALGLIPIVNENDTVATEELRFGDNDRLAAALATVVEADLLVLLSDVDALYDRDPRRHHDASPIREVVLVDDELRDGALGPGSELGTGGMRSKLEAARLAAQAGVPMIIASGAMPGVIAALLAGQPLGTRFLPPPERPNRRKHWIGFLSRLRGTLEVDAGAVRALRERGSSLLPAGVTGIEGTFERGDAVQVRGPDGAPVARGLVSYSSEELALVKGKRSEDVASLLRLDAVDPAVHRDDLVLAE